MVAMEDRDYLAHSGRLDLVRTPRRPSITFLLLILFIAALPFGLKPLPHIPLYLCEAVALLAGASSIMRNVTTRCELPSSPMLWASMMFASATFSSLRAADGMVAFKADVLYAICFGLFLAVVTSGSGEWGSRFLIAGASAVGSLVCVLAGLYAGVLTSQFGGAVIVGRATGIFGQPNELGSLAAIVLILGFGGAVSTDSGWQRIAYSGMSLAAVWALAGSASRGAVIGSIVGLVALPFVLKRRRLVITAIYLAVFPLLVALLISSPAGTTLGTFRARLTSIAPGDVGPQDERRAIWAEAERQFRDSPVLGVGPGNYPYAALRNPYRQYSLLPTVSTTGVIGAAGPDHGHNILLTTAAEEGMLGLVALFGFSISVARRLGRKYQVGRSGEVKGIAIAALSTILGQGTVDYVFRNSLLLLLVWLLLGIVCIPVRTTSSTSVGQIPFARAKPHD